jgi:hypothetical protein
MMVLGLRVSETPPLVGGGQEFYNIKHNVDRQELRDPLKWKDVPCCSASFFHYPYSSLNVGYVVIGTRQVYQRSAWHRLEQGLERREFTIGVHRRDMKSSLEIILVHLLERLEILRNSSVRKMIDIREIYLATKCQ